MPSMLGNKLLIPCDSAKNIPVFNASRKQLTKMTPKT
jgi:hypothetical protein